MNSTTPKHRTVYSAVGFIACALFTLVGISGCGVVKNLEEEDAGFLQLYSLASNATSTVSNCAQNAFRSVVHPSFVQNCNGCHGAAQGSATVSVAYLAVKARTNFSNVSNSAIVRKVADANHCSNCGASFSSSTAARIEIWKKAEAGDAATCAEYATAIDGGGGSVKPFDLGSYTPPNPNDTIIIAQGLTEFSKSGGVHQILRAQCQQCHIPGGFSGFAPFAVADATTAYRETKPRTNFGNVEGSVIYQKASIVNHGGGCSNCGNAAMLASLKTAMTDWATMENAGVTLSQVILGTKTFTSSSTSQTLTWVLGNDAEVETAGAHVSLAGAEFKIDVRNATGSDSTYRFSNPRLKSGSKVIRVKKLAFILNGTAQPTASSYFTVDTQVPVNTNEKILATFPALVPIPNVGAPNDIKFEFDILQGL